MKKLLFLFLLLTATSLVFGQSKQTKTVPTIAALQALVPTDGDTVEVLGRSAKGDGGGGTFYWDQNSATTADDGIVFAGRSGFSGKWKRRFSGPILPQWFGAVGDGATDDTAAFQAAWDANVSGGEIYLPGGTFAITRWTLGNKTNVTIRGGNDSIIKLTGTGSGIDYAGLVLTNTLKDITIKGFTIRGDGQLASRQGGIVSNYGIDVENLTIEGVRIEDVIAGIIISGDNDDPVNGIKIQRNWIENIVGTGSGEGYGIATSLGGNRRINAVVEGNWITRAQRHSIYWSVGYGGTIQNNFIIEHRYGLAPNAFTLGAINIARTVGVTAIGNHIINSHDAGMQVLTDSGYEISHVSVIGNEFTGKQVNFPDLLIGNSSPSSSGLPRYVTVTGNTFCQTNYYESPIQITSGKDVTIVGNVFSITNAPGNAAALHITPAGEDGGDAEYMDRIVFGLNTGSIHNDAGAAYGVLLNEAGTTNNINVAISGNRIGGPSQFTRFVGTQSNTGVTYSDNDTAGSTEGLNAIAEFGNATIGGVATFQTNLYLAVNKTLVSNAGSAAGGSVHWTMRNQDERRWGLGMIGTETGSNAGAEFALSSYDDDEVFAANILRVTRSGVATFASRVGAVTVSAGVSGSMNSSAIIQADSTSRGFLPPRMTKAQRDAISSPANGLVIYQTDGTAGLKAYIGGSWFTLDATADP